MTGVPVVKKKGGASSDYTVGPESNKQMSYVGSMNGLDKQHNTGHPHN